MATLAQIREGLRANLAANLDLGANSAVQVSAYALSNPTGPYVQVFGPEEITFHRAMGNGHADWTMTVQVGVPLTLDRGAQELLDRMLESSGGASIRAAIESDTTLGGVVQQAIVTGVSGYAQYVSGQGDYLGCEFSVAVIA